MQEHDLDEKVLDRTTVKDKHTSSEQRFASWRRGIGTHNRTADSLVLYQTMSVGLQPDTVSIDKGS